jgi:hypothetical protein
MRPRLLGLLATAIVVLAAGSNLDSRTDRAAGEAVANTMARRGDVFELGSGQPLGEGPAKENSGIVKSRQWPDLFWMHNDSGDEPRLYPVRRDGSVYESSRYPETPGVLVGGAINVDWEDITVDASGHIIVADIGNNGNDRRDLVLYYLAEPSPDAGRTMALRRIFVRYPEQSEFPAPADDFNYDAEAIFALGNDVFICTKHRSDTLTRVYRLLIDRAVDVQTLELVDTFDVEGQATGADATPAGDKIVITTYDSLWLFEDVDARRPLSGSVRRLQFSPADGDVEAVCFADDETLLLAAEAAQRIYEVPLESFRPVATEPEESALKPPSRKAAEYVGEVICGGEP